MYAPRPKKDRRDKSLKKLHPSSIGGTSENQGGVAGEGR